jgi:hypothetical protein
MTTSDQESMLPGGSAEPPIPTPTETGVSTGSVSLSGSSLKSKMGVSAGIVGVQIAIIRPVAVLATGSLPDGWDYFTDEYMAYTSASSYVAGTLTFGEVLRNAACLRDWPVKTFIRMLEIWHKVSPDLFRRGYHATPKLLRSLAGLLGNANSRQDVIRGINGEWRLQSLDALNNYKHRVPLLSEEGIQAARAAAKANRRLE